MFKARKIILSPWSLIILLCVLQILLAFNPAYSRLTFDEAIWHYIGRNWFRYGLIPYSGGVDNKSPLIYIIYGLSDLLFGINFWFPRLLAIISQSIGLYFVYRITKYIADDKAGIIALILYGLSLTWKSTDGNFVSQTQAYEITFLIISFYFYFVAKKNSDFFYSGIIAGVAIAFKLTAVLPSSVIFLILLYRKKNVLAFIYGAGILITVCLTIGSFLLSGINLQHLVDYSLLDNFTRGSITDHPFSWKLQQFINQFFYSEMVLFYPFLIVWLIIKKNKADVLTLWLIASVASLCIIGMFARSHLKELLPVLSIINAISISYLMGKYTISLRKTIIALLIIFFPKTINLFLPFKNIFSFNHLTTITNPAAQDNLKHKLGLWIKSNTKPTEKVYVAGYSSEVQVYSERLSPSIYFNVTQTPLAKRQLFYDLKTNKADLIAIPLFPSYVNLVDKDIQDYVHNLVAKNYYEDTCLFMYKIYRRKDTITFNNF